MYNDRYVKSSILSKHFKVMYPSSLATPKIARIHPPNLATPGIEPCATYREAWASKYVKKYTCNISTFLWRAEIRRSYPKRDLSFCTSIRGYSFVGPCLQSWFRGTLQNKLKERKKSSSSQLKFQVQMKVCLSVHSL